VVPEIEITGGGVKGWKAPKPYIQIVPQPR
jgi:hypothetical protein